MLIYYGIRNKGICRRYNKYKFDICKCDYNSLYCLVISNRGGK